MHILLVDDNTDVLETYSELLSDAGYQVSTCKTGLGALVRVGVERPDLVILDLKLGDISGLDVHRALRTDPTFHSLPIFFVSGVILDQDAIRAQACDPEIRLLLKPLNAEELIQTVRESVSSAHQKPEAA